MIDGNLSLGDFTAFYTYLLMLIGPMRMLGMSLGMAQRAVASGNRLFEILDREPQDRPARRTRRRCPTGRARSSSGTSASRYDGAEPALRGVDLEVEAGRTVALVGPDRLGKDEPGRPDRAPLRPDGGRGADRRRRPALGRRRLAARARSPSSPTTASCSRRPWPRTSPTRGPRRPASEIEPAARRAQAHGSSPRLPDGYETMVGERGLTLSGGQRQRVAIARALLADPRILILDDATSSVDARTEAAIKRGLREVMEGRTTFVVAHRLSTISLADEIVVMEAGRIVDRGTHEELLERCPLYAEIAEFGLRGLGLPAARPRGARGGGAAVSRGERSSRTTAIATAPDPVTEPDPEAQGSEVAERDRGPGEPAGAARRHAADVARPLAAAPRRGPARRARSAGCSACCAPTGAR